MLVCSYNDITGLVLNEAAPYLLVDVRYNYMADENAVTGKDIEWDDHFYLFWPQKTLLLDSIAITEPPDKTAYVVGEALDLAGMVVTATYKDMSTQVVTDYDTVPADGAVLNTVGPQTVTVSYMEDGVTETATFTVTVNEAMIYAASIDPFNSHTFYSAVEGYGEQDAQVFTITNTGTGVLTGLSAALSSGEFFEVSAVLSGTTIEPGETATVSVRPKTGLAEGYYTDKLTVTGDNDIELSVNLGFTVNAAPVTLTGIAVTTPPTKTVYTEGEALDLEGMVVTASYSNYTSAAITGYTTVPANGAILSTVGTVTVTVSYMEDGVTEIATFTVTVNAKPLSSIATLSSLSVSAGTLTPTFDPETTSYTVTVTNSVSSITITATATDAKATVSGAGTKTLAVGANSFNIVVTAENGTTKTYTVVVTREAPSDISDAEFLRERAADILKNGLSKDNLRLEGKTLTLVIDGREFVLSTNANNRNISGEIYLGDGYYLVFDFKGNGSNVKDFRIIRK